MYISKKKLKFKLAELRTATFNFGQQHNVPNAVGGIECVYFTTEVVNVAHSSRIQSVTRPLQGITDVLQIADWMWLQTPHNWSVAQWPGYAQDMIWGSVWIKGKDMYMLRNQSNEQVKITCYYCTARKSDNYNQVLPSIDPGTGTVQVAQNVYNWLGSGFAENGIDINTQFANNAGMTRDEETPFHSKMFTRQFKINRVKRIFIGPGKTKNVYMQSRWREHKPVNYVTSQGASAAFSSRTNRFASLKGERFILFKLSGNIGGVAGQTGIEKTIGQTTPTVIMLTKRKYWAKHEPKPIGNALNFGDAGIVTNTASIIVDSDEVAGAEIEAS